MAGVKEKQAAPAPAPAEQKSDIPTAEEIVNLLMKRLPKDSEEVDIIDIHLKALDDLVNVNSLFTIAVFVGLSLATPGQLSLAKRTECHADPDVAKKLIMYEVLAFACFLLSSLVAKVLKLNLNLRRKKVMAPHFDKKDLMLSIAAVSSVAGIVFLTLSIVNVIQIRLGKLSCGSMDSIAAVLSLCLIVGLGLSIYAVSSAIAVYASFKKDSEISRLEKEKDAEKQ